MTQGSRARSRFSRTGSRNSEIDQPPKSELIPPWLSRAPGGRDRRNGNLQRILVPMFSNLGIPLIKEFESTFLRNQGSGILSAAQWPLTAAGPARRVATPGCSPLGGGYRARIMTKATGSGGQPKRWTHWPPAFSSDCSGSPHLC